MKKLILFMTIIFASVLYSQPVSFSISSDSVFLSFRGGSAPIKFSPSLQNGLTSNIQTQLTAKVNKTGSETIAGVKTFSSYLIANSLYPPADLFGLVGVPGARWWSGCFNYLNTNHLVLPDPVDPTDTTVITFSTDGGVTFETNVNTTGIYIRNPGRTDSTLMSFSDNQVKFADNIITKGIYIQNAGGTDSSKITIATDGKIKFERSVEVTDTSGVTLNVTYFDAGETPNDVSDSTLTIDYANSIRFLLPGANMTNLETINMTSIPAGSVTHVVYFTINENMDFSVTFQDKDSSFSSDGNLQLEGDFTLTVGDVLVLMYIADIDEWYEVARKNNH